MLVVEVFSKNEVNIGIGNISAIQRIQKGSRDGNFNIPT